MFREPCPEGRRLTRGLLPRPSDEGGRADSACYRLAGVRKYAFGGLSAALNPNYVLIKMAYDEFNPGTGGRRGEPQGRRVVSGHARRHRRRGHDHRPRRPRHLHEPRRRDAHRMVGGRGPREAPGRRLPHRQRETRKPIEQPVRKVIDTGLVRGLGNHTLLIARDGSERPIDDSAAPIWGERGERRRGRPHLPGHHRTQAWRAAHRRRPGRTPRASWPRCGGRSWSSTGTSTSGRRIAPSTRPSGSPRPRPSADSSTTSGTASGTSRP